MLSPIHLIKELIIMAVDGCAHDWEPIGHDLTEEEKRYMID